MGQQATRTCPTCGEPTAQRFRPFCSKRCADVDLGRWFTGAYAIPTEEAPDEYDAVPPDTDSGQEGY